MDRYDRKKVLPMGFWAPDVAWPAGFLAGVVPVLAGAASAAAGLF